jgi:hypothetical protein
MFSFSKVQFTLASLFAGLMLTGCMDGEFDQLDDPFDDELLLDQAELELDAEAPEPWDDTGADMLIDDLAAPPPGPCDPPPPPLQLAAPELSEDDEASLPPPPLVIEAPEILDEEDEDELEDEDDLDDEGEDLSPAPFGVDAPELDGEEPEPPVELDNPEDVDPGYEPW